ncbi:MAG: UDP-2,4-diacetamido-2,4,6-trideoxy-beta-L-altropyranose hydrolase [Cyanobacteria bacterium REEB67]|nr:UDP-2,4-diacetamido-2,4,6-trideoxy-beta-L-altropyranose hydrolase [Cyanobacteria bacterium REEB67]
MPDSEAPKQSQLSPALIRVDASESIGIGHVMRCLALAGALKDHGEPVTFLCAQCPAALVDSLKHRGFAVEFLPPAMKPGSEADARFTAERARRLDRNKIDGDGARPIVIIDGYHFFEDYQVILDQYPLRVAFMDDLHHCKRYYTDIVINQNPSARAENYPNTAAKTKLLLGAPMILIRGEFLDHRRKQARREQPARARKILVTMGGADIDNVTSKVMGGLSQIEDLEVTVLIGGGNTHLADIQKLADALNNAHTRSRFTCLQNASDMAAVIDDCDLVVSAGGTTVWEAAYLGAPTAVIITADNQVEGMEYFAAAGATALLGRQEKLSEADIACALAPLLDSQEIRKSLAQKAAVIDGQGARRVLDTIASIVVPAT